MKTEFIFGIDVDEVLRALLPEMVAMYNELLSEHNIKPIEINDVKDFVVENSFPLVAELTGIPPSEWFFRINGHQLFRHSPAIEGASKAVRILRKYGKVIIISYQKTMWNKIDTLEWLNEHGIEYDGICFMKDKTPVHCTIFIDDNAWNFIGCNASMGVLINAPYNTDADTEEVREKSNCCAITRYNSLIDFAKDFDRIVNS